MEIAEGWIFHGDTKCTEGLAWGGNILYTHQNSPDNGKQKMVSVLEYNSLNLVQGTCHGQSHQDLGPSLTLTTAAWHPQTVSVPLISIVSEIC